MHASLYGEDLFLLCAIVATVLCTSYFWSHSSGPNFKRKILISTLVGMGASALSWLLIKQAFPADSVPTSPLYIAFILYSLICLLLITLRKGLKSFSLGIASIVALILLQAVSINRAYHYFPTVSSIFTDSRSLLASNGTTVTRSANSISNRPTSLEQQLSPNPRIPGVISSVNIPGKTSSFKARNAIVYLPAAYTRADDPGLHFPVLILLNGTPGSPEDWLRSGNLAQTLDSFAARHEGVTPIIVIPDHSGTFTNDTECVDSKRGNSEQYLSVDVPSFIRQTYNVSPLPGNWGIGGLSEGGMCAAMLTLRHQDTYRHFLDMSGESAPNIKDQQSTIRELFKNSKRSYEEHNVDWLLQNVPVNSHITGRFVIGGSESKLLLAQMRNTYLLAKNKGLTVTIETIPNGAHSYSVWSQGLKDAFPSISYLLGATKCEASCN